MRLNYSIPRYAFGDRYTHYTDSSMEDLAEQMEGQVITHKDEKAGQILSAQYHAQDECMDLILHVTDGSEIVNLLTTEMFINRGNNGCS